VAAWPTVALVGSYELLMLVIRGSQAAPGGMSSSADNPDPLGARAAEIFADQLAADRVPSIRAIRAQLHVGASLGPSGCGTTSLQGLRVGRKVPLRKPLAGSVSSHGRASRATAAFLMMII
jgi:hypothetical protein